MSSELTIFGALRNAMTARSVPAGLQQPHDRSNAWYRISEPFTGAWQRNQEETRETLFEYSPLFRCISLISSDVAKLRPMLVEEGDGIWTESYSAAFSPVIRKPNHFQNRIQFYANWMESKLSAGNTYVLKARDNRGVVVALYVLDPLRCKPLVAPNGEVFYRLKKDNLAEVTEDDLIVPASEIIHDRWNTLFHPLVGLSPIYACFLGASQGLSIQRTAARFFQNNSTAPGILTAAANIPDDTAKRIKEHWEQNYTGDNSKRVAVLGDGLKFEAMSFNAVDSQLNEQMKSSAESVCTAFGVPAYKIGVGQMPSYNNIQALSLTYYSDALQIHIESIELLLDEGLGLTAVQGKTYGVEFDLDNLLRMDTATLVEAEAKATGAGIKKINEARRRLGLGKVTGGDTPYLQQQNYSLTALAKRDAQDDPFASKSPTAPAPTEEDADNDNSPEQIAAEAQFGAWALEQRFREIRIERTKVA